MNVLVLSRCVLSGSGLSLLWFFLGSWSLLLGGYYTRHVNSNVFIYPPRTLPSNCWTKMCSQAAATIRNMGRERTLGSSEMGTTVDTRVFYVTGRVLAAVLLVCLPLLRLRVLLESWLLLSIICCEMDND